MFINRVSGIIANKSQQYRAQVAKEVFTKQFSQVVPCDMFWRAAQVIDERPKVLVLDNFDSMLHGELIAAILKGKDDLVRIGSINDSKNTVAGEAVENFNLFIKKARDLVKRDKSIKAVNISIVSEFYVDEYKSLFNLPITRDNVAGYKDQIRELLLDFKNYKKKTEKQKYLAKSLKELKIPEMIKLLEEIVNEGVKVYICAGNEGKQEIIANSFAKGVNIVGALGQNEKIADYSPANSLINQYAQGIYYLKFRAKQIGTLVFDVQGGRANNDCPFAIQKHNPFLKFLLQSDEPIPGKYFVGPRTIKHVKECLSKKNLTEQEKAFVEYFNERYAKKLIKIEDYYKITKMTKAEYEKLSSMGNYMTCDWINILNIGEDRRLIKPEIHTLEEGTSFATPAAIRQDILNGVI